MISDAQMALLQHTHFGVLGMLYPLRFRRVYGYRYVGRRLRLFVVLCAVLC